MPFDAFEVPDAELDSAFKTKPLSDISIDNGNAYSSEELWRLKSLVYRYSDLWHDYGGR